jgi:hypothetical protein
MALTDCPKCWMAEEYCTCNLHIKQIFMNEETVTISKKEYESLKEDARWLQCLENAGVDNWEGYDYARELLNEEND